MSIQQDEIVVERLARSNGLFLDGQRIEARAHTGAEQAQLQIGGVLLGVLRQAATRPFHESLTPEALPPEDRHEEPMFLVQWRVQRGVSVSGMLVGVKSVHVTS